MFERFAKLARARLHLPEQSRVLDGNDRLTGETLDHLDLLACERAHLLAENANGPDEYALFEHRHN